MIGTRKNLIFATGLLVALFGFFALPNKAEAASGGCHFGALSGTCSVSGDGAYGTNDIFTGRSTSGSGSAMGGVNTKGEIVNYIVSRFNGSNAHNKTGAQFIVSTMLYGHGAHQSRPGAADLNTWVDLIWSASVDVSVINGATVCVTSWYVPSVNNTFFDNYSGGCRTRDIIRIKQNGYVIADIERLCGNMTGRQDRVLHTWVIGASSTVSAGTVYAGQSVSWTHRVYYAGGNGRTSVNIKGKIQWGGNGPTGTYGADPLYDEEFSPGEVKTYTPGYTTTGADIGKTICQRITYNNTAYNNLSSGASAWACVVVLDPNIYCSLSVSPGDPDPFTKLTYTVSYNTPVVSGTTALRLSFHDNGSYAQTLSATVASGNLNYSFTVNPPAGGFAVGNSAALATISAFGKSATCGAANGNSNNPCTTGGNCGTVDCTNGSSCTCTVSTCPPPLITPIAPEPYLSAYGGDVIAGTVPTIANSCSATANSHVVSWNHDAKSPAYGAGDYAGGGGRAAVFASGNMGHFSSGLNIANLKPTGLSFSNTNGTAVNVAAYQYGGKFTATPPTGCDFTSGTPTNNASADLTIPGLALGDNTDKYYSVTGGNVYISNNIVYTNSGAYASLGAIPSFKLIVTGGNIYIGSGVTQLDGLYIAIPNSSGVGGQIFTCASGLGAPVLKSSTSYAGTCGNQLKIYGAFAAKKINFDRSYGTIGKATAGDTFQTDGAAEQFIYTPEMWLPNGSGDDSTGILFYQGLPPVL